MTNGPEQPYRGPEFPAPDGSTQPLDYPANPGLPPPVHSDGWSQPGGYPPPGFPAPGYPAPGHQQPGYPPPYPPYAGGYPYDPYRAAQPAGTNGKAIAALVCALTGLLCGLPAVVGVVLGIIAMRETRRTGQDGWGLALAGVIVGGLITAGMLLYVLLIVGMFASGVTTF
jgi:hypothetical protein